MHTRVMAMGPLVALIVAVTISDPSGVRLVAQSAPSGAEWRAYSGSNASMKYSPLDQINKDTVRNLRIAWRQSVTPVEVREGATAPAPTNYQHTPLMVDGLLYMTTGYGSVAAVNATTGKVVWFDARPRFPAPQVTGNVVHHDDPAQPGLFVVSGRGWTTRGFAYWTDGRDGRVIAVLGQALVALNAKTGTRYPDFGTSGEVDLRKGYERTVDAYRWGGPPLVVGDVIVVGGMAAAGDRSLPGDVRGYDVRTGALRWTFHAVPRSGDFGHDTWQNGSA